MSKRLINEMAQAIVETLWPPKPSRRDGTGNYRSWGEISDAAHDAWRERAAIIIARIGVDKLTNEMSENVHSVLQHVEGMYEMLENEDCHEYNCAKCELVQVADLLREALGIQLDDVVAS